MTFDGDAQYLIYSEPASRYGYVAKGNLCTLSLFELATDKSTGAVDMGIRESGLPVGSQKLNMDATSILCEFGYLASGKGQLSLTWLSVCCEVQRNRREEECDCN